MYSFTNEIAQIGQNSAMNKRKKEIMLTLVREIDRLYRLAPVSSD